MSSKYVVQKCTILYIISIIQINAFNYAEEKLYLSKLQWNFGIPYNGLFLEDNDFDDMELFSHQNVNYSSLMMTCLMKSSPTLFKVESNLLLFQMDEEHSIWNLKYNITIQQKNILKAVTVDDGTLIILFDNTNGLEHNKLDEYSLVYHLDDNQRLRLMQTLISGPIFDVNIWSNGNQVFLTLLCNTKISGSFNTIYSWKGSHFDVIQLLASQNMRKIEIAQFESTIFLGLAILKHGLDLTMEIEIYTFCEDKGIFIFSHKLKSGKVINIFFFTSGLNTGPEFFLIAEANYHRKRTTILENSSMIYKLSGQFVPFQNVDIDGVKGWIVLKEYDGTIILVITLEGVIVLKTDGWIFTIIDSIKFNNLPISVPIKSVKVFQILSKNVIAFITCNPGMPVIFYEINFPRLPNFDNFSTILNKWAELMLNDLSKSLDKHYIHDRIRKFEFVYMQKLRYIAFVSIMDKVTIEHAIAENFSDDYMYKNGYINTNLLTLINTSKEMGHLLQFIQIAYDNALSYENVLKSTKLLVNNLKITSNDVPEFKHLLVNNFIQRNLENPFKDWNRILKRGIIPTLITNRLTTKLINNFTVDDLRYNIRNQIKINGLKVDGNINVYNNIFVEGNLNTVNFSTHNVLLKNGPQEFYDSIVLSNVNIEKLETYNNIKYNISKFLKDGKQIHSHQKEYDQITVKSVNVRGSLGRTNVDKLKTNVLTLDSDHNITEKYKILLLQGNKVKYSNSSQAEKFVNISLENELELNQDVFLADGEIITLGIKERLNNIFVKDDKLQLLEKISRRPVFMNRKTFDTLELLQPINLHGRITSSHLRSINVKTPTILTGGNLTIETNGI